MTPQIYLDNAATTSMDPEVLKAMLPYFTEKYGNPEALHTKGKESLIAVDNARETVAKILNCREREVIFCGTATEANNLAIFGTARANKDKGNHLVTTKIEHSSVRRPFEQLEKEGFEITLLDVDKEGFVDPEELRRALTPKTIFVSIMYANNEIGTIEPIKEIGEILQDHQAYFHTDACQIPGAESLDTKDLKIDMMTLNGSKIYGPKGIGVLFANKDVKIKPIIFGSSHEHSLRAGTHNTPNIVGFAKALELVTKHDNKNIKKLRDKLINALIEKIPRSHLNGPTTRRLPNNINITILGIHAQEILLHLDEIGIYISTGAACNMGNEKPSKTLEAIGLPQKEILSSFRITLGKNTTAEDINYVIERFPQIVEDLR